MNAARQDLTSSHDVPTKVIKFTEPRTQVVDMKDILSSRHEEGRIVPLFRPRELSLEEIDFIGQNPEAELVELYGQQAEILRQLTDDRKTSAEYARRMSAHDKTLAAHTQRLDAHDARLDVIGRNAKTIYLSQKRTATEAGYMRMQMEAAGRNIVALNARFAGIQHEQIKLNKYAAYACGIISAGIAAALTISQLAL